MSSLPSKAVRGVFELIGECRELGDDASLWANHLCRGMAQLLDADVTAAGQIGGVTRGSIENLGAVDGGWERGFNRDGWLNALRTFGENPFYHPCMVQGYQMAAAGATCVRQLAIYDPDGDWRRTEDYERTTQLMGCEDELFSFFRIATGIDDIQGLLLYRDARKPAFSEEERALFREIVDVVQPLIGGPLAGYREIRPTQLPPRVRQVLACLLEGDGDKQIASRLKLSVYTVRQYAKQIYRHFHVDGRNELMARWIKRAWGAKFAWRSGEVPEVVVEVPA